MCLVMTFARGRDRLKDFKYLYNLCFAAEEQKNEVSHYLYLEL